MDINITIKCPDLPLAAAALAKAISGLSAPTRSPAEAEAPMKDEAPVEVNVPYIPAAPVQTAVPVSPVPEAPVAVNPTPAGHSPATPAPTPQFAPTSTTAPASPMYTPAMTTPTAAPTAPTAPAAVPTTPAPQITGDMVAKAGADLIAANPAAMVQLNGLLQKYGVGCAQELRPDQIGPFATEMRALGARI